MKTAAIVVGAVALVATGVGAVAGGAVFLGASVATIGTIATVASSALTLATALTTPKPSAAASGSQTTFSANPDDALPLAIGRKAAATWTLRFDTKGKMFQGGVPAPMWIVRGTRCYDPTKDSTYPGGSGPHRMADPSDRAAYDAAQDTWEYTENPYLIAMRWAHGIWQRDRSNPNSTYERVMGIGAPLAMIDVPSFVEGRNVAAANGWKAGGIIYSTDGKWDTMKRVLQAGMGEPLALGARISCLVNTPKVSLATITIDDVVGPASVAGTQPRRDRVNTITPRYRLEANNWQFLPGPPISVAAHVSEDKGKRSRLQDYAFIQSTPQVATAVRYDIENAREFGPIVLPLKLVWMGFKPGDCVTATLPELGLNAQPILLLNRELSPGNGIVTMTARSETAAKHPFALGQTTTPPPSPGVTSAPLVPVPRDGDWTLSAAPANGGRVTPSLVITGAAAANVDGIVFEYRPFDSGAPWMAAGTAAAKVTVFEIAGLPGAGSYEAAVSYVRAGVVGDRRIIGPVGVGDPALSWTHVTDPEGTRPEDNATVGAPVGTPVAGVAAEIVIQRIDALVETYGDTVAAEEYAQAAEASKNAAEVASANAAAARDQAGAARSAAEGARETAIQKAGEAGGFATTASNKSDEAKGYSEAASASATVANTKAGQASTSASAAATSKDDAEGFSASASAASEAAAGSATAARSTSARLYPSDFARAGEFFTQLTGDPDTAPGVTAYPVYSIVSDAAGKLLRLTNPGLYQQTRTRALIPNQAGRRWRIEARVRVFQNGPRPILFALNPYGLQSDFTTIVYSGHAVTHLTAFGPGMVAADGWRTIYLEFTCGGGVCPWIAPSIYVYSNIPGVGDATPSPCIVEYQYLRVTDITEPYAASTSASSASASQDGAVEAASAAQGHSNTASTRASEARTYRDEAATSASNAGGSAATASQQAGLAAGSASAAGGSASAAQSSASVASTKADEAGASATVASTAKQEAISARDAAQSSAGNASGSASVASGHAAAALEYRNTTATYRDQAAGSASSASLSAQSASQSAAQVDADVGAISQRVDSVEATANGASASASQSAAAIAGINGQLASRLVLESVAGNNRAQVKLYASANGGAGVDIIGDTTFRGKVILDNGSIMIAMGIGFGTNNQFLEWVGPSRDLSQCNEASALRYVRKDGQAYFRGAFLAGDLRAGQQNPSLAANVTADTGLIGSNGGEIQAVASWTYSRQTVVNYPGTAQGRNNFIAAAQAAGAVDDGTGYWSSSASVGIGDNVLTVAKEGVIQASATINTGVRNFFGYEPVLADQAPGSSTTTITAGGSVTFSDPERATRTRSFQATLSRSGNLAGPSSQRVGIATAE